MSLRIEGEGDGAAIGGLIRGIGPTLIIAAGAVTPTHTSHPIDTEAAAPADDLDTITPSNALPGDRIALRQVDAARDVTIKNSTGNIITNTSADLNLLNLTRRADIFWDGTIWGALRYLG